MELRHETVQTVPIGVLLRYKTATPNQPITGASLSWYWWTKIIKSDGVVVDIKTRNWTDVSNCDGMYFLTLLPSDTDVLGTLIVYIMDVELGYPIYKEFCVINKNNYDSKYSINDSLFVESRHARGG